MHGATDRRYARLECGGTLAWVNWEPRPGNEDDHTNTCIEALRVQHLLPGVKLSKDQSREVPLLGPQHPQRKLWSLDHLIRASEKRLETVISSALWLPSDLHAPGCAGIGQLD